MSNYWKKKLDELNQQTANTNKSTSTTKSTTSSNSSKKKKNYWDQKMDELEASQKNDDIAPVYTSPSAETHLYQGDKSKVTTGKDEEKKDKWYEGWFQKGKGNVAQNIAGTVGDTAENLAAGGMNLIEKLRDSILTLGTNMSAPDIREYAYTNNLDPNEEVKKAKEEIAKEVAKDKIDGEAIAKETSKKILNGIDVDDYSYFGEKMDSTIQSGAELLGTAALQLGGVPWFVTTGLSSYGGEVESALGEGASWEEANISGFITAGAEILTEKISGGIKFKGVTLDDALTKQLATKITSKFWKKAAQFGLDVTGEAAEEWIAQDIGSFGQWLTYRDDEELSELLFSEEAMDAKIEAAIGGGLLGGVSNISKAVKGNIKGVDSVTNLTKSEQKVLDAEFNSRVAEAEKGGKKLTAKEKSELYNDTFKALERGEISTDTIESVLGGEDYKRYKTETERQEALKKELDELRNTPKGQLTDIQSERMDFLKAHPTNTDMLDTLKSSIDTKIRTELDADSKRLGKNRGSFLVESYNEVDRQYRAIEVNPEITGKQKELLDAIAKKGQVNNTRRSREFWEYATKVGAQRGLNVTSADTAEILEMESKRAGEKWVNEHADELIAEHGEEWLNEHRDELVKEYGDQYVKENFDGKTPNAFIMDDGTLALNVESRKVREVTFGHEIGHDIKNADKANGTKYYAELQEQLLAYAEKVEGEAFKQRKGTTEKLYSNGLGEVNDELTNDLIGEYIYGDKNSDFIKNLSVENKGLFKWLWDEVKYLYNMATAGSQDQRELLRIKKLFEKAYRESANVKTDAKGERNLSVSETTDGRFVAVVDSDILSNIDTTSWDDAKKTEAKKAASDALKQFNDGIVVDGITRKVNRTTRQEYTRSKYTEHLYNTNPDVFADKMRAADVADDIVVVTTNWNRDGGLKHPRTDNFVDFDHGNALIMSGNAKYRAEVVVGITSNGEAVLYDVVDMTPATFDIKKEESYTTVTTQNAIDGINKDSSVEGSLTHPEANVNTEFSLSDSDGNQLSEGQQAYFKDSVLRDENGNLKVMYHGSQDAGFHTFESRFSDDDTSFFFVDRNEVAASYSGTSETYEAQTIRNADDMNKFIESIDAEGYEVIEKDGKFILLYEGDRVAASDTAKGIYEEFCWYEGVGEGDANYKVYLNLTNPLVVDGKGRPWNKIDAEFSQEVYDKYQSLTAEEKEALTDLAEWEDFRVFNSEIQEARDNELASAYKKMGEDVNIYDLFSVAADNFSEESMRENARKYLKTRDYAQRAKEQGYDGVIFNNIVDNGGYSNGSEGASTVAIAFDSSQIKSVANKEPTSDSDIRYSLSEDSKGREIGDAVKKRFANSKVVDEKGRLKAVYHGTYQGEFTIFDKAKGSVEGDFGSGFYFTDNEFDVEEHYEGGGPDFEVKVGRRADQIMNDNPDLSYEEAEERAHKELYQGSHKFEVYLNIEKPAIVGETNLFEQESYFSEYNQDDYDNEEDYYADVEQLVADDIDGIIWELERNVDVDNTDGIAEILWNAFNNGGIGIEELKKQVNNLYLEDSEGNLVGNEVTRQIIESLGYDGIIDPTVSGKWNMDMEAGTTHYIVFKPNQIKSVTNQNPTDNPDINLSLSYADEPIAKGAMSETRRLTREKATKDIAPTQEDIAPLPLYFERSDPSVEELKAKQAELEPLIMEALQADDMETFERLSYEHQSLTERIAQTQEADNAYHSERISTLDDSLAPIEQEIEYGEENREATTLTKAKRNSIYKSVKDILGLSGRDAQGLRELIDEYAANETIDREQLFELIQDKFGRQTETVGDDYIKLAKESLRKSKIKVSPEIKADIADYEVLRKSLFNKIGFSVNGMGVDEAYKEISKEFPGVFKDEHKIKTPSDQFLALVKIANESGVETVEFAVDEDTLYEAADAIINGVNQYQQEQLQKLAEAQARQFPKIAPDEAIAPIGENVKRTKPQTEAYEAIRPPKQNNEPRMARATPEEQARAEILTEEPKVEKKKNRFWSQFMEKVVDKGFVFERLSKKTKNRELEAKWNFTRYADGNAQTFMREGAEGVSSLKSIVDRVEKSGKTKEFYEYLYHQHNVDRMTLAERNLGENKAVFGNSTTAESSMEVVAKLERANPEFKALAEEVYTYNKHLRQMLVDGGVISQETADLWEKMYPHYVPIRRLGDSGLNINVPLDSGKTGVNAPIKRAKGGSRDILPLFDTMAQRTLQTYKAVARNRFGVELKNTLNSTIASEATDIDGIIESIDSQDGLLQEGKNGRKPTFTVFENGKKVTFEITEDMYDALKPKSEMMAYTHKFLNGLSNLQRNILTQYNPVFMLSNAVKDVQDVLLNSQHAAKTYANMPKAIKEMVTKGKWYTEYVRNGGEQNTYFDNESNTFKEERRGIKKLVGMPLDIISYANNAIEKLPRLAEYIASRESGRSVEVSMLDAARVTTNFAAGGDVAKLLNRNGATFLNASIQGFMQQARNVSEAKMNGFKGWVNLATKFAIAGLAAEALNQLLWDDDEEYEELSDYVKQNYYVVAKTEDGTFIRIPKGRAVAVIQDAVKVVSDAATGNDEVDLKNFLDLAIANLAPNNPFENNVVAPIIQVAKNKTWYGEDLVPTRLQDLPAAEQFDESTDSISKWLGEKTGLSPYKINYVLDQYSGGVGDVFFPMLTPEAESGDNSLLGNMLAPLKDKFTTDSVMNNQNVSDFYDMMDELTANAKSSKATDKDVLKSKFINAVNSELSELYKQKREIQSSDMTDEEKYSAVRDIQKQINAITKESLNDYKGVTIDEGYATVGDLHYRVNKDGEWTKITDKQLVKQKNVTRGLGISASEYWGNKEEYDFAYDYSDKYRFFKANGITYQDYANADEDGKRAYSWAAENPKKYEISKVISNDVIEYRSYISDLYDLKADYKNGKAISGSAKEKKIEYINSLDNLDYGQRIILFKSLYESDDTYNYDIVEYLNSRSDINRTEMITILKELGFTVSSDGTVTW